MQARLVHACCNLHDNANLVLTICMHIMLWRALDCAASGLALASASSISCKPAAVQSKSRSWDACNQTMAGGVTNTERAGISPA